MAKFVTFDDGCGTYNFRAIFPAKATRTEIKDTIIRKLVKDLRSKGLDKEDLPTKDEVKEWTTIRNFREGRIYEPSAYQVQWND